MSSPDIRQLNTELQKIAKDELNEDPEKIQENLETLKEWIRKSPHLNARMNDQFLVTFLRGCKYSMERAKQKLDMYYTLRTHMPEILVDRDPMNDKLNEIIKLGVALPLPVTETPGSPRLFLFRSGAYDAHKFTMQEVMKVNGMIADLLMVDDDNFAIAGQIAVCDLANVTFAHFVQAQPAFMKKMTMLMQEGTPIRQKGIHYINTPPTFEKLFNVFKGFMNEKMRSRVSVLG